MIEISVGEEIMSLFKLIRFCGVILILVGGLAYVTLDNKADSNMAWKAFKTVCEPNVGKGYNGQRRMKTAALQMEPGDEGDNPFVKDKEDGSRWWRYDHDGTNFKVEVGKRAKYCMVHVDVSRTLLKAKIREDGHYRKAEGCTFEGERISRRKRTKDMYVEFFRHKEERRLVLISISGSTTPGWYLYRAPSAAAATREITSGGQCDWRDEEGAA